MEETVLQLEKSTKMSEFLKEHKISKHLRSNINIEFPSVLQANAIPILKEEDSVVLQYTPPAGVKLTYLLPLLTRAIKAKAAGKYTNLSKDIQLLGTTCHLLSS